MGVLYERLNEPKDGEGVPIEEFRFLHACTFLRLKFRDWLISAKHRETVDLDTKPSNSIPEKMQKYRVPSVDGVAGIWLPRNIVSVDADFFVLKDFEFEKGYTLGTPQYMSPEQAKGEFDYRSELCSIGISALYIATGRLTFLTSIGVLEVVRDNMREAIDDHINEVLGPNCIEKLPASYQNHIEAFLSLVRSFTSEDPSNRPDTFEKYVKKCKGSCFLMYGPEYM